MVWYVLLSILVDLECEVFILIPRSQSYCLSLPLCLEWYNRSITPRVHSAVTNEYSVGFTTGRLRPLNKCVTTVWSGIMSFNTHLSHSRQWFNIHRNFGNCWSKTFYRSDAFYVIINRTKQ